MQSDTLETLFGGAAGGGKSHGQLLDALRFAVCYPGSRQLMLRRTMPELEHSLVPAALRLYPQCIAKYKVSEHRWDFANGSALEFAHILVQCFRGHRLERFRRAENRAAKCRAAVAALEQLVDGNILRRILVHVDLLENDTALQLQILLCKTGMQEHIRQQSHRVFQPAVQNLHIVSCAFLICECIRLPA